MTGTIVEIILAIASLSGFAGVILSHIQWKEKFKLQTQMFEETKRSLEKDISTVRKGMSEYKDAINKLTGSMYKALYGVKADRLYIVQPLPLDNTKYLVVKFEVDEKGIQECMKTIGNFDITKYYSLYSNLKNNDFLYYRHISDISDPNSRHVVSSHGADMLAAHRVLDNGGRYLGSIICEWMDDHDLHLTEVKKYMDECAEDIQFFLPPVAE